MSFNQQNYINNFNKKTYKSFLFRVRKDDEKILKKLAEQEAINKYLTDLVRKDIDSGILTLKEIKDRIRPVIDKHNVKDVYLFGSYSRGEANNRSDVDIYCDKGDIVGLIEAAGFERELKEALGKEVDVIFFSSTMDDNLRHNLERDKVKIW